MCFCSFGLYRSLWVGRLQGCFPFRDGFHFREGRCQYQRCIVVRAQDPLLLDRHSSLLHSDVAASALAIGASPHPYRLLPCRHIFQSLIHRFHLRIAFFAYSPEEPQAPR